MPSDEEIRKDFAKSMWPNIVFKDGKLDEVQVMRELLDFDDMMDRFGTVLKEATGGSMSKLTYTAPAMTQQINSFIEEQCQRAIDDYIANQNLPLRDAI